MDIEANGFLHVVTRIHCAVFRDLKGKVVKRFTPDTLHELPNFMDGIEILIGHNILSYDLPVILKILKYTYTGKKVDTLLMSRLLNPKRMLPFNALDKRAGPHSLYAWGVRVGIDKPEHSDWENYSEAMLHRCEEDTHINVLTYHKLLEEAANDNWMPAFKLTFRLFECLQKQEEYGWKVDLQYMHFLLGVLDRAVSRIDRKITPNLPTVVDVLESKIKGEYNHIKKPFNKSGAYSKAVIDFFGDTSKEILSRHIAGPFSRIAFRPVDVNSNAETKDYLLSLGWEPLEWNTNDEGERTSPKLSKEDPFEGLQGTLGKLIARRVQCRQRRSIIAGLINIVRDDGAIPSVINNLADTSRATHRNIVNIPKASSFFGKQMRKMFIARDGKVLVSTDSDSCQLRMLGGRMGDPAYINAIVTGDKDKGTDLHSLTKKIAELESRDIAKNVMYCVPMNTQVLSRTGWKTRDQLGIGELVLTYNQHTKLKEWKPILAFHEKEDEVIKLSHGHNFSISATRDHRWFVMQRRYIAKSQSYGKLNGRYMDYQIKTTDALNKESNIITNAPMTPDMEGVPIDWSTAKYGTDWTKAVCQTTSEARKGFLAGFLIADGCWQNGRWQFAQNEGPLYDAALAAMYIESQGYIHVSTTKGTNKSIKSAKLSKKSHTTMMKMTREVLPIQKVWCLSTENESFVIRQGDTVTITGNCLLFGGGDPKLGKTAKKPGEGADIRQRLYKGFDGLGAHMEELLKYWRSTAKKRWNAKWNKMEYYDGYIIGLDGRPIKVPFEHQLLVYELQSDEAIMMTAAYVKTFTELSAKYKWGEQWAIICFYHK